MTYLRLPRGDRQMYSFGQLNPDARPYAPQVVDVGPGPTRRPAGMYRPQVVELGPAEAAQVGSEGMMAGALAPDATPFQPQVASLGGVQGGLGVQLSPVGPSMPQVVPLGGMGEQLDPQAEPFRPQVVSLAGQLDTEASAYQPQYLRMAGNCGVRSPGLGEQLDPQASPYQPQYVQLAGYGQPRVATPPVAAGPVTTLPAGTNVNAELFQRADGSYEWGGGPLLEPLAVRRMPDGSYVAVGRARIQVVAHVNTGRRARLVPTATR